MKPPWELAGNFSFTERHYSLDASKVKVLEYNTARVAIVFCFSADDAQGSVSTVFGGDVSLGIISGPAQAKIIKLTWNWDGPIVFQEWWYANDGPQTLTVFETVLLKDPCTGGSSGNVQTRNSNGQFPL